MTILYLAPDKGTYKCAVFYMKNHLLATAILVLLISGCQRQKDTICGVPVQGTLWQLAAAIADKGDGSFIPESVYRVNVDEAIIEGWLIDDESKNRPFSWTVSFQRAKVQQIFQPCK